MKEQSARGSPVSCLSDFGAVLTEATRRRQKLRESLSVKFVFPRRPRDAAAAENVEVSGNVFSARVS